MDFITKFSAVMCKYQKDNGIIKQCVTNTLYLLDTIKANTNIPAKCQAVIFYKETEYKFIVHLVVVLGDDNLIDPSYEIDLQEGLYLPNITSVINRSLISGDSKRELIKTFVTFKKIEDEINAGEFIICRKEFYIKQADYCKDFFELM